MDIEEKTLEVFFCYARKDQALLVELKNHLSELKREKHIILWTDIDMDAGAEWEKEIHRHLNTAQITLLLVSPDFMASDYCRSVEMQRALERHKRGETNVIPIILRPVYWKGEALGKLQALPTDGKPVTTWNNQDDAFYTIVLGIQSAVETFITKGEQLRKAEEARQARLVEQARLAEVERIRSAEEAEQARKRKKERQQRAREEQELKIREEQALQAEEEKSRPLSFEAPMLPVEPAGQSSSSFVVGHPAATIGAPSSAPAPKEKHVENAPMVISSSRAADSQTLKFPLNAPIDGVDALGSVRSRTLPSTWRVLPHPNPIYAALGSFIICGIVGMFIFFIVLGIADSLPVAHNIFVQMHINMTSTDGTYGLPNSLQWVQWVPAGIGGILGSVYAWKEQMNFVLVLLPYGFVYGKKSQKQASLVVNFQEVTVMSVLRPKDMIVMILATGLTRAFIKQFWNRLKIFPRGFLDEALSVTLLTSSGETSTIVPEDIESDDIPSIIAAYERFKARSSV